MAKTKIYRKAGIIILDIDGTPNRLQFEKVSFDLTKKNLIISEPIRSKEKVMITVPLPDVENEAGTPVGDYDAIEDYIADLKIEVYSSH